jgi:hypothetical protein
MLADATLLHELKVNRSNGNSGDCIYLSGGNGEDNLCSRNGYVCTDFYLLRLHFYDRPVIPNAVSANLSLISCTESSVAVFDSNNNARGKFFIPEVVFFATGPYCGNRFNRLWYPHRQRWWADRRTESSERSDGCWGSSADRGSRSLHLCSDPNLTGSVVADRGIWQRRYWEHTLRDEDFARHTDYIHYNPVKHGHVDRVTDWPFSSFHRMVRLGMYPEDWAGAADEENSAFGER